MHHFSAGAVVLATAEFEAVVAGVVCGYPVMRMREFAKRSGISQRKAYVTRRVALGKLAKACREKGIE